MQKRLQDLLDEGRMLRKSIEVISREADSPFRSHLAVDPRLPGGARGDVSDPSKRGPRKGPGKG